MRLEAEILVLLPQSIEFRLDRHRCGFGCSICGCAIVQYHHFAPKYSDAREHKAEGITLLCGTCHDRASKGFLGEDQIRDFDLNPRCRQQGFTGDLLFASRDTVNFQIGSATFRQRAILAFDDELLIGFAPPEAPDGPLRLSARLGDDRGICLIDICDNNWRVGVDHYDVEMTANVLVIRRRLGDISMRMAMHANGAIVLERIQMGYKGFLVSAINGACTVRLPNGGQLTLSCPSINATLKLRNNGTCAIGPWPPRVPSVPHRSRSD